MEKKLKISATGLSLFVDCKLCFWLKYNKKIQRPSFPVASITMGMDRVIKEYMNRYRGKQIPPWLKGKVPGKLIEFLPKTLTHEYKGILLKGMLDECLVMKNGMHAALDHKTKGFEVKEVHHSHQLQMDAYTYLLQNNGHKTGDAAFLVHYIPTFGELHNGIPFKLDIRKLKVDPERIPKMLDEIIKLLDGKKPKASKECNYCKYVEKRNQ